MEQYTVDHIFVIVLCIVLFILSLIYKAVDEINKYYNKYGNKGSLEVYEKVQSKLNRLEATIWILIGVLIWLVAVKDGVNI